MDSQNAISKQYTDFRIRPIATLILLISLFVINTIAILSYQYGLEVLHFNILFYMYFNFWVNFFLIISQLGKTKRETTP